MKKTKDGRCIRGSRGLQPRLAHVGPKQNRGPLGLEQRQRGFRVMEDVGVSSVSLVTPPSAQQPPALPAYRSKPVPAIELGDSDDDAPLSYPTPKPPSRSAESSSVVNSATASTTTATSTVAPATAALSRKAAASSSCLGPSQINTGTTPTSYHYTADTITRTNTTNNTRST